MNKNIFAFVALLAVANAVPYGAAPARLPYAAAPSVVYEQNPVVVEVAQPASGYGAPASVGYGAAAPALGGYGSLAPALAPAVGGYGSLAPAGYGASSLVAPAPIPLIAVGSNPQASARAVAQQSALNPGSYSKLAIPSYSIVSAEPGPETSIIAKYSPLLSLALPAPVNVPAYPAGNSY